jgi:serine/threonine protein phosphatase PrpC
VTAAEAADERVTVRAYGLSDAGHKRTNNEDAFIIADLTRVAEEPVRDREITLDATIKAVLLAVSDGMGGANAGEVASAMAVDALRRAMREGEGDWDDVTRRAVERANAEVFSAAAAPDHRGMGATLTAVCLHGQHAHVAAVGDSRAYLLRGGRIRQMTRDQSFVQYLVDSGAISDEQRDTFAMKNIVLQAMGQKQDVAVALGRLALRRGDRLLLCSDGLSNQVSPVDMQSILDRAPTLPAACWELVELAKARGGDDNITVVVAEVSGDGLDLADSDASLTRTFEVLAEYKATSGDLGLVAESDESDDEPRIVALDLRSSAAPRSDASRSAATVPPADPRHDPAPVAAPSPSMVVPLLAVAVVALAVLFFVFVAR